MRSVANEIAVKVEQEIKHLEELLRIVEQERDVLLEGGHERLVPLAEAKVQLSHELAAIQEERRALVRQFLPDGPEVISLEEVEQRMNDPLKSAFRKTVRGMRVVASRLKDLNETNKVFVQEALGTVEHVLGIIMGASEPNKGAYGPRTGSLRTPPPRIMHREV